MRAAQEEEWGGWAQQGEAGVPRQLSTSALWRGKGEGDWLDSVDRDRELKKEKGKENGGQFAQWQI